MIIVDYSQVCLANLMKQIGNSKNNEIEVDLVRHMVLNSIRSISKRFKNNGNIVIAADGPSYWRREVFPNYKANRKKAREKTGHDWAAIFQILHKIRDEMAENMPYRVIRVDGAEADDIIAILTKKYCPHENVIIVSHDNDFVQLQTNKNVKQWSPVQSRFITTKTPHRDKLEHILRGDRGDGIPNVLSPDDCLVTGQRQKSLNSERITEWLEMDYEKLMNDPQIAHGFSRNRMLIDFDNIPTKIVEEIILQYENIKPKPRAMMMNYFMANRLTNLLNSIEEF